MTEQILFNITVTPSAQNRIKRQLLKRGTGLGIRLGVKTTGCSGFSYVLEFVDSATDQDACVSLEGFSVIIDKAHIPYLQGMTLDFVKQGLNEGFSFSNPNEKDRCGCGESFRI